MLRNRWAHVVGMGGRILRNTHRVAALSSNPASRRGQEGGPCNAAIQTKGAGDHPASQRGAAVTEVGDTPLGAALRGCTGEPAVP